MDNGDPLERWTQEILGTGRASRGTQAIRRAFLVLRVVALGRDSGRGLSTISSETGLTRPTVRRILTALIAEGAVEQRPRTQRYRAPQYAELLELLSHASPLLRETNMVLDEAADAIGDNVSLTMRNGLETVCVARRLGSYPVQVVSLGIGVRRPIFDTSSSIAILSTLDADEARSILAKTQQRSPGHKPDIDVVMERVEEARARGYAYREQGIVPGTRALSIPTGPRPGPASTILTVTAIARRITPQRIDTVVELMRQCAGKLDALIYSDQPISA